MVFCPQKSERNKLTDKYKAVCLQLFAYKANLLLLLVVTSSFLSWNGPSIAFAQSAFVKFQDIQIPVDTSVAVDDHHTQFKVGGVSKIVKNDDLIKEVLEAYLGNAAGGNILKIELLKSVLKNAQKNNLPGIASRALLLLLTTAGLSQEESQVIIEETFEYSSVGSAATTFKIITSHPNFTRLAIKNQIVISFFTGLSDLAWYRTHLLSNVILHGDLIRGYAEKRFAAALSVENTQLASAIADVLNETFPAHSDQYRKYRLAVQQIENLKTKGDSYTISDLFPILSLKNSDQEIRKILSPFVIEKIHKLAENSLQAGNAENALLVLTNIEPDERTPNTHNIIKAALRSLHRASRVISNSRLNALLRASAQTDLSLHDELINFLSQKTLVLIQANRPSESLEAFADLLKLSPDPKLFNDRLRVQMALGFLGFEDRKHARLMLDSMQSPVLWLERLDLFIAGLYGNVLFYVVLMVVPVVIRYGYEIVFPSKGEGVTVPEPQQQYSGETAEEHISRNISRSYEEGTSRAFVTHKNSQQLNPHYEEYLECLSLFGLDETADLKSIKIAYRNVVKEIHPDLNANATEEMRSKFVELTQAYDRLCELQKMFRP